MGKCTHHQPVGTPRVGFRQQDLANTTMVRLDAIHLRIDVMPFEKSGNIVRRRAFLHDRKDVVEIFLDEQDIGMGTELASKKDRRFQCRTG